ncbi:MAG TPA: hypothetical protein VGJ15_09785 [Pirellulales bacterium]|jgi:hypothetical protein
MPGKMVLAALRKVWTALEPLNIPMAVMGGISVSAWGYLRNTQDVDVLVGVDKSQFEPVLNAAYQAGLRPKRHPVLFRIDQQDIAQLLFTPPEIQWDVQVDLLLVSTEYQRVAILRREVIKLADLDIPIAILSCEDVVLHKLIAGRIIDRADAAMLLRENKTEIDFAYLSHWVAKLQLQNELKEIYGEAFPDEPLPAEFAG